MNIKGKYKYCLLLLCLVVIIFYLIYIYYKNIDCIINEKKIKVETTGEKKELYFNPKESKIYEFSILDFDNSYVDYEILEDGKVKYEGRLSKDDNLTNVDLNKDKKYTIIINPTIENNHKQQSELFYFDEITIKFK